MDETPIAFEIARSRLYYRAAALHFLFSANNFRLFLRANFHPDEPRVPAGNSDGGQWTVGNGSSLRTHVGRLPAIRVSEKPNDDLPKIPKEPPPATSQRWAIVKRLASWAAETALRGTPIGRIIEGIRVIEWIRDYYPYIEAYRAPARSLEQLEEDALTPEKGYDIHHIVEQTPAEQDGFPRSQIESTENRVRVPTLKHWQITGWYMKKNGSFGGLSPRTYLRGKSWEERMQVGLMALRDAGVLKP